MGIFVEKLTTDESICALKESVSIKDLLHLLPVDHGKKKIITNRLNNQYVPKIMQNLLRKFKTHVCSLMTIRNEARHMFIKMTDL